ncbi:MAG: glycosyltransferase family 2 protein [Salibacteraceae bacterium]
MKVAGFSFVRNALKYDYPIVEAITSILPLCDLFVVAVGHSEDNTLELIQSIDSPKLKILETEWDDSLREGGRVLAEETNKALRAIPEDYDWAFYIQGDEVIHEQYHAALKRGMEQWKNHQEVEGLLLHYTHFYGSYDYVGISRRWYRREVRIVRPKAAITSYRDAQGFRKNDRKLQVKPVEAHMYHYGWVKPPEKQQAKQESFNKLWHDDQWMEKNVPKRAAFDYSEIDALARFKGSHPAVMQARVDRSNWQFDHDLSRTNFTAKEALLYRIERLTGWRVGEYKNFKLI